MEKHTTIKREESNEKINNYIFIDTNLYEFNKIEHDKHDEHDGHYRHDGHDKHYKHYRHDGHDKHDEHDEHDKHDEHDEHDEHDGHDGHDGHERKSINENSNENKVVDDIGINIPERWNNIKRNLNYVYPHTYPHPHNSYLSKIYDDKHNKNSDKSIDKNANFNYVQHSYYKNISCVNCGEKGHVVKDCIRPITSFGIIAFKTVNNANESVYDKNNKLKEILGDANDNDKNEEYPKIKMLMIQRKDTMGYIDFLRGKYPSNPLQVREKWQKIRVCLNEMTFKEKHALLNTSFDELWSNLWVNHDSKCFKNEYIQAKHKFELLNIPKLIKESETKFTYQEFGFPKGRRNMKETNILCAEREFYEETGYGKNSYDFITNYPIIQEEFMGTNGVEYRHIYYLVKMKNNIKDHPPKVDFTNKVQIGEVKNIGWLSINECLSLIRPYDTDKKRVISTVYNDIINMHGYYNLSEFYKNNLYNTCKYKTRYYPKYFAKK